MREQVVDVPPQEVITSDNVVVAVDAVIYYEPTDPQRLIYNVANFILAVTKLAQTNLRNVIGDLSLDEALTSRDKLNLELRQILDDATDKWGVKVVRVEIQRIDPPPDVMSAMHEQMKAERDASCTGDHRGRLPGGLDHEGRGREAGGDPHRRGRAAQPGPRGRGSGDRRCGRWRKPNASGPRRPRPVRPPRSATSTEPSTTATPPTTCSRSSTSRPYQRWPTVRPPRSTCRWSPAA